MCKGFLFTFTSVIMPHNHEKFKNMVTYFNRKDLVSFGNFLLSEERKQNVSDSRDEWIRQNPNATYPSVEELLSEVSHADVENWKYKEENKPRETKG